MIKFKLLLTIALLLTVMVSCNRKPDDNKIQENITKQLQANEDFAGVNSTVKNGVVTLTGICKGDGCAARIEKDIKDLKGVKKVENNIVKDNTTEMTMRTSLQSIITKYPGVQADVTSGVITIRGTIDRENLSSLMSDLSTLQPKKIDNQLVVR